jgi:hypothetical protein
MGDLLALDFRYTLPPLVHPKVVGYQGEHDIFISSNHVRNLGACHWSKEIGAGRLVRTRSRCFTFEGKGGSSLQRPSNSCDAHFILGLNINLDKLKDEATPKITPTETSDSSFLFNLRVEDSTQRRTLRVQHRLIGG